MNKILKYILIVDIILIISFGSMLLFSSLGKIYGHQVGGGFDEQGQPRLVMFVPNQFFQTISNLFGFLMFYLFPIFIVFISGLYQFKNPSIKGYFKSLLIPLSYVIIGFILMMILARIESWVGEEAIAAMYILFQLAVTFIAVVIVNLIIFGVKSINNK